MDETVTSGGFDFGQVVTGLFGLASKKIEADAAIKSRQVWGDQRLYGIDEYGRPYLRGATGSPFGYPAAPISGGALLLVGAVVVALIAFKN